MSFDSRFVTVVGSSLLVVGALLPRVAWAAPPPSAETPDAASESDTAPIKKKGVDVELSPGPPLESAPKSTRYVPAMAPPGLTLKVGPDDDLEFTMGAAYWTRGSMRSIGASREIIWGVPQRVRGSIGVRWRALSTFVQFQDVRVWGQETSTRATLPNTGVHQGYMQLEGKRGDYTGYLRLGRQELALGSLRLLGNAPWNPNSQAFDGLRLHGEVAPEGKGTYGIDLSGSLVAAPVIFEREEDDGSISRVQTNGEWFATAQLFARPHKAVELEAYTFFDSKAPSELFPNRERYLVTPGLRVHGEPIKGLEYDVEGYAQAGRYDDREHFAWSAAATVRYEHEIKPPADSKRPVLTPAVVASYALASGESCETGPEDGLPCSTGTHNAFDPLYGSRHRYLGYADWFAFTNVKGAQGGLELGVGKWMQARAHYHFFQLYEPDGAWIRTSLTPVGGGWDPQATDPNVGHEIDARLQFRPWRPMGIDLGYAVFMPVGTGADLLGSKPQHFSYLMVSMVF